MWFSLLFWDLASGRDLSTSMLPFLVNMDCLLHFMLACSDVATADYLKTILKFEYMKGDTFHVGMPGHTYRLRTYCFIDIDIY